MCRLGSSVRTITIAGFAATGVLGELDALSGAASAFASEVVPLTGDFASGFGTESAPDGKPPVETEPSRETEASGTCDPGNGAAVEESFAPPAGPEVAIAETVAPVLADSIGPGGSGVVDCGAADLRRKMPPSPNETGDAGLPDRPLLELNGGPTTTMIRFPSLLTV